MQLPDRKEAKSWEGLPVVDRDGTSIGRCDGVYADTDTGVTEWLDVGVPDAGRTFVPALGAEEHDGAVRVDFTRALVMSAPHVGDSVQLSKADERTLYAHYGVRTTTEHSDSLLPEAADVAGDADPVTEPIRTASSDDTTTTTVGGTAAAAGTAAAVGTAATVGTGGWCERPDLPTVFTTVDR